jgi:predicted Zn-dependent peptidase
MRRFKLKNGLTVLLDPRDSPTVTIEVSVNTGSNNESHNIAGISHFLEHMMFEGTKSRSAKQISEMIENAGGEFNAATSNERTAFHVKLLSSKFEVGLDILSDMMINPAFDPKILEKERNVVLEEIKMVNDQPMLYQWVLFEKTVFKKHPTKNPVYGRVDSVKSISRKQMFDYYRKWYSPNNMMVTVVGGVKDPLPRIERYFGSLSPRNIPKTKKVVEPVDSSPTIKLEKRDINQVYLVLGFKTMPRTHKDSYVLDVISAIFTKGISGRISDEIRVKRGLAYAVGAINESKKDYGFFAFYLNCAKKNLELCKSIIFEEIKKLDNLQNPELADAKTHLVGRNMVDNEDSHKRADELAFWESIKDAKLADTYKNNVRKVTKQDIIRVRNRFLSRNHTMVMIGK